MSSRLIDARTPPHDPGPKVIQSHSWNLDNTDDTDTPINNILSIGLALHPHLHQSIENYIYTSISNYFTSPFIL